MADNEIQQVDGFSTSITLANIPTVLLEEKSVTPPGVSAGGGIDVTTMRNTAWRTMAPKSLKSLTPVSGTVSYATTVYSDVIAQLGVNQLITVTFPDGATLQFYGWLDEFTPNENTEGEQPTAAITIVPSLRHSTTGAETAPVYNYTAPSA